jgi:TRAP transporter TAXI family solute receptor
LFEILKPETSAKYKHHKKRRVKMMTTKKWLGSIGVLLMVVLVGGLIHGETALAAPKKVMLDFWAGPFGGTPYTVLFAIMDTMNKTHPRYRGSIKETEGSWDNALHAGENKVRRPFVVTHNDYNTFLASMSGADRRMKGRKLIPKGDRLVFGTSMHSGQLLVTFDSKIKTGKDLKGKRLAGWTAGSGAWPTLEMLFKMWGTSFDDLKSYDGMSTKAKVNALKDGLVDVIHLSEPFVPGKPNAMSANLAELLADPRPLYYIPLSKRLYDPVAAEYKAEGRSPFLWKKLPAGHWNKDWPAGGMNVVVAVLYVYKEASEELQYELAKLLIEKNDQIVGHGAQASLLIPSILLGGLPIESEDQMAPGALKYYKESGVWNKYWKK